MGRARLDVFLNGALRVRQDGLDQLRPGVLLVMENSDGLGLGHVQIGRRKFTLPLWRVVC